MLLSKDTLKFVAAHCIACMQLLIGLNTDNILVCNTAKLAGKLQCGQKAYKVPFILMPPNCTVSRNVSLSKVYTSFTNSF